MPIIGSGTGTYSFIHVDDAAAATVAALTHVLLGIYNIVDDAPAPVSEWLPIYAELVSAPAPERVSETAALEAVGRFPVYMMTEQRGASNTKAKRELGWRSSQGSWRTGFNMLLTDG